LAAIRSFLARSRKRKKNIPKQQKKTIAGLDNVGFIGAQGEAEQNPGLEYKKRPALKS
jgi:hypothetical protein